MITLIATLLIVGLLLGLLYWIFTKVELLQPFAPIMLVVVVVLFVILVIKIAVLPLAGVHNSWLWQ